MFECVDRQTNRRRLDWYTISSGELMTKNMTKSTFTSRTPNHVRYRLGYCRLVTVHIISNEYQSVFFTLQMTFALKRRPPVLDSKH